MNKLALEGVLFKNSYITNTILKAIQFESARPQSENKEIEWRDSFLFEHLFVHNRIPRSKGIIKLDRKYVWFLVDAPDCEWIFDLDRNPEETVNFADSSAYTAVKANLIAETDHLINKIKN